MYLKRLDVYGFKTFAQRTTFEFQPGVTAVVGPNGSGKSNVADAVRWVLGEQSFGNLRSKRTDDLIFGGGHNRAPMGFAEVFLTIDNTDRLLPLDFDEVTIGRRAYRNGENEYTINRARVRLRDVLDAVAPLGSSYTLINQGLVDSALALQPEERRRLFEDAAEIGPYQAKKHEAERRLRETEANLLRLNDLASELEPQLRTLKRQARDAEAVHAVEAELHALLLDYYAVQWRYVTAQLAAASAHEQAVAAQLATARTDREHTEQALATARDALRLRREERETQRAMLAAAQRTCDAHTRDLLVAQERQAGLQNRAATLQQRCGELDAARTAAETEQQRLREAANTARAALNQARTDLQAAEHALSAQFAQLSAAEQDVAGARDAVLRATTALETAKARAAQAERRHAALFAEHADLQRAREQAIGERDGQAAVVTQAQRAADRAQHQLIAAGQALDVHQAERERLRQARERLDERWSAARRTHGDLQMRYDALSRLARSYDGTFAGVRAAMQWAEREALPFRLVSSLLQVPLELETAIEVALGARLQQIVVGQWADAEAAIAHLKRTNAGRATFLPLDTLRPAARRAAPNSPGTRGIAADLITVDALYAAVAEYLLGRTLVADDLHAARRALPKLDGGWTIVTLAGEQVATGGALTGGAATRESGTLRRERELRELPAKVDAARADAEQIAAQRTQLQHEAAALQQTIADAERAVRAASTERETRQSALETSRRALGRADDAVQNVAQRLAAVETEQAALDEQRRVLETTVAAAEQHLITKQATLHTADAQAEAQRTALRESEQALQPLRDAQAQHAADVRSLDAAIRTAAQTLDRLAAERAALDAQAEQLQREQRTLAEQIQGLEQAQQQALAAVQDAAALHAAVDQALRHAEAEAETLDQTARQRTGALLALESTHADAALAAQRAAAARDTLWTRAAEDNIDVEATGNREQGTENSEQTVNQGLEQRIGQLRLRLRRMGPVNALAPAEYAAAQERHTFLTEQLADVRAAAAALRTAINDLDGVMHERFETTFEAIGHEFERTFKQLFGGGSAKLSLVRAADHAPVGGVDIVAQPPGKRLLNLQLLSGGERSLTAAALLFAILKVNPSPFCMLDEVDAALDEANVVRFREALLELAERTQFVIITHNRGTVEAANTLYGITMGDDGGSRVVSLRLEEVDAEGSLALAT